MADELDVKKEELFGDTSVSRPHVVILGAGASIASFPEGDANGKLLPSMDNFIEVLGLNALLDKNNIEWKDINFEAIYSKLYEKNPHSDILREMESVIYSYFSDLKMPDSPTLYDHLILSLRPKDIIVTFNWDPFLFDAWERSSDKIQLPSIVFLHGNVRIGYCTKHRVKGLNGLLCTECDEIIKPSRLLYPVTEKDYKNEPFIKEEWEQFEYMLEYACALTIFGYGAPDTDIEAIEIMKRAWKSEGERELEETEIIDIKDHGELASTWEPFLFSSHYQIHDDFYESWIPNHSRRSCEAYVPPNISGKFVEEYPIPRTVDFNKLYKWLKPII